MQRTFLLVLNVEKITHEKFSTEHIDVMNSILHNVSTVSANRDAALQATSLYECHHSKAESKQLIKSGFMKPQSPAPRCYVKESYKGPLRSLL